MLAGMETAEKTMRIHPDNVGWWLGADWPPGRPCPNSSMTLITTHDKIFELQAGETLLEGLERTGHEVEYQCRSGYCGSCRVKLLSGRVEYDEFPLAFIGPGEALPCCCKVVEPITVACRASATERDLFDTDLFAEE